MSYKVEILRSAQRQLAKLDPQQRSRVVDAIRGLGRNPRPPGCRKLTGRPAWRIRAGDYRVIYEVHDRRLVVLVVAVRHRRDAYR